MWYAVIAIRSDNKPYISVITDEIEFAKQDAEHINTSRPKDIAHVVSIEYDLGSAGLLPEDVGTVLMTEMGPHMIDQRRPRNVFQLTTSPLWGHGVVVETFWNRSDAEDGQYFHASANSLRTYIHIVCVTSHKPKE